MASLALARRLRKQTLSRCSLTGGAGGGGGPARDNTGRGTVGGVPEAVGSSFSEANLRSRPKGPVTLAAIGMWTSPVERHLRSLVDGKPGRVDRVAVQVAGHCGRNRRGCDHGYRYGKTAMGQFEHESQPGQGGLHRSAYHRCSSHHRKSSKRRARPQVGPPETDERAEHGPRAERWGKQPAGGAALQAQGGNDGLEGKKRQRQQKRAVADKDVVRHVLTVAKKLWVDDADEPEHPERPEHRRHRPQPLGPAVRDPAHEADVADGAQPHAGSRHHRENGQGPAQVVLRYVYIGGVLG